MGFHGFAVIVMLHVAVLSTAAHGIVLSSSVESDDGHVTVCPDTTITFTCSDTGVTGMRWFVLPLLNEDNSPGLGSNVIEIGDTLVVDDVFTIALVARELMDNFTGNYTSTLDVVMNDIMIPNGTNVTCFTPNIASLLIFKQGASNA